MCIIRLLYSSACGFLWRGISPPSNVILPPSPPTVVGNTVRSCPNCDMHRFWRTSKYFVKHARARVYSPFSGITRVAGTRKVKAIWISLKQETVSGSGISWATCKSATRSRQITTPAPHHSVFYRPDALPAAQPTASKHWRHPKYFVKLCIIIIISEDMLPSTHPHWEGSQGTPLPFDLPHPVALVHPKSSEIVCRTAYSNSLSISAFQPFNSDTFQSPFTRWRQVETTGPGGFPFGPRGPQLFLGKFWPTEFCYPFKHYRSLH